MSIKELYYKIVSEFGSAKNKKTPIASLIRDYNFNVCESDTKNDEYYHAELFDDTYKIVAYIKSYSHDRTFQPRPDTNHNYLELYENSIRIDSREYMYEDDF